MRREEILKVLIEAGTPISTEELSKRTGIDVVRLRVDLYHLIEEGKIEKRLRGNLPVWTVKIGSIPEHHFERHRKFL